jgi:hypothetical protein
MQILGAVQLVKLPKWINNGPDGSKIPLLFYPETGHRRPSRPLKETSPANPLPAGLPISTPKIR